MLNRPCGKCGGAVLRDGDGKGWGLSGPRWVCANCGWDGRRRLATAGERWETARKGAEGDYGGWEEVEATAREDMAAIAAGATLGDLNLGGPAWKKRRAALLKGQNGNGNGHKAAVSVPAWLVAEGPDLAAPIYGQLGFILVEK